MSQADRDPFLGSSEAGRAPNVERDVDTDADDDEYHPGDSDDNDDRDESSAVDELCVREGDSDESPDCKGGDDGSDSEKAGAALE